MAENNYIEDFKKAMNEICIEYNLRKRESYIQSEIFNDIAFKQVSILCVSFSLMIFVPYFAKQICLNKFQLILISFLNLILVSIFAFYFQYRVNKKLEKAKKVLFRIYKIKKERGYIKHFNINNENLP